MAATYIAYNGASPTTAAIAPVTTGTAIKTLLQIATPATRNIRIVEWGISFDGSSAATPIKVELVQTDVAATVTAYGAADLIKLNGPNDEASVMTTGSTTGSGFTATVEGTITATRVLDYQLVSPTGGYLKQFPLGREPVIPISKFLRIRVTTGAAVNAVAYLAYEE